MLSRTTTDQGGKEMKTSTNHERNKKSIAGLLCTACFAFALLHTGGVTAFAADSIIRNMNQNREYDLIADAFAEADSGDVLQLQGDAALNSSIESKTDTVLDLNGYSLNLSGKNIVNEKGDLSIINSGAEDSEEVHYFSISVEGWDVETELSEKEKESASDVERISDLEGVSLVKVKGSIIYNGVGFGTLSLGGAVSNYQSGGKDLTIENVSFVNCKAGLGGVVENEGLVTENYAATVTMSNVNAYGCSAANGGVVYNAPGRKLKMMNVTARFCSALENGGAVLNLGQADITSLHAAYCDATSQGGAICNGTSVPTRAEMIIRDSDFTGCNASMEKIAMGGAIVNYRPLTIEGSYFTDCSAESGAGIYNMHELLLKECFISNCVAKRYGGAIFTDGINNGENRPGGMGLDAKAVLEDTVVAGCSSVDHDNYEESIYVRNTAFEMKSGFVEGMIFTRNDVQHPVEELRSEVDAFPASSVVIHKGKFRNFIPAEAFLAEGSSLVDLGEEGICYVVNGSFATQPTPNAIKLQEKETKTVFWVCGSEADSFKLMSFDQEKNTWSVYAQPTVLSGGAGYFDFTNNETAAKEMTLKVIAMKAGEPVAVSDLFNVSYKVSAASKPSTNPPVEDPGKKDEAKPASVGSKLAASSGEKG